MAELTATATCTAYRAVMEATGELVGPRVLAERVGWMAQLAGQLAEQIVAACWTETDLGILAGGIDSVGRQLPAKGWMTIRRLGWAATPPAGVYLPDRLARAGEEAAARMLRQAVRRRAVIAAILATWPHNPARRTEAEWTALRRLLPSGITSTEVRNRTRQVRAWQAKHAGRLPTGLTELESPPSSVPMVLLAAADKQLVTFTRTGERTAQLRVKLPVTATPSAPANWPWHRIEVSVPGCVPAEASLATPTVRPVEGRVRVDLPWRVSVPPAPRAGHVVGLGLDWGVNTLLTGSIGKLAVTRSGVRVVSDGRRLRFDATGVSAKLHRLRSHREHLAARRDHYARLLGGLSDGAPQRHRLAGKHTVLTVEHERVCARIRHLNHALAWSAARWTVDQAAALGAAVIYLEDLATLEARGHRRGNARLSGQIRGVVAGAIRHLASRQGIATVIVPARGTSRCCPRCGGVLKHVLAPDRPSTAGWKWAVCPCCGLSCDRDHAAAERIVARGLLGQAHLRTDPKTGAHTVIKTVDGNVARARRPKRRTRAARRADRPAAVRRQRVRRRPSPARPTTSLSKTSRRVPDWRAVPAPAAGLAASQRPAGPEPQPHLHPRVWAGADPAHDCPPTSGRHRPEIGRGFHRKVRATPMLPLGAFGPPPPGHALPAALHHAGRRQSATLPEPPGNRPDGDDRSDRSVSLDSGAFRAAWCRPIGAQLVPSGAVAADIERPLP